MAWQKGKSIENTKEPNAPNAFSSKTKFMKLKNRKTARASGKEQKRGAATATAASSKTELEMHTHTETERDREGIEAQSHRKRVCVAHTRECQIHNLQSNCDLKIYTCEK